MMFITFYIVYYLDCNSKYHFQTMSHDVRPRNYSQHNCNISFSMCTKGTGVHVPIEQAIENSLSNGY